MVLESVVEDMLLNLRRHHNRLTSSHKLPSELLYSIFEYTYGSAVDHTDSALTLSSVCQRWRDTAISLPTMWTDMFISPEPSDIQELFLERSKTAPLHVIIEIPTDSGEDYANVTEEVTLLAEKKDRILSIKIDSPYNREDAFESLDFPAPLLERFSCIVRLDPEDSEPDFDNMPPLLSDHLFDNQTPSLRRVDLTDVDWEALDSFSNLIELRLTTHLWEDEAWNFEDYLLPLLVRSPLLEHLAITGFRFPYDEIFGSIPDSPISLQKLSVVSLVRTQSRLILSFLNNPNITKLTIRNPVQPAHGDPSFFLPEDPSLLTITQRLYWLKITAKSNDDSQYRFQVRGGLTKAKSSRGSFVYYVDDDRPISFDFEMEDEPSTTINEAWNYISTTSLSGLSELNIDWMLSKWPTPPSQDKIRALFVNLPSLSHLCLGQYGCDEFIKPFISESNLCPDLSFITARVSWASYEKTFHVLNSVACARKAVGKEVGFWYVTAAMHDEVARDWNELCDKHEIYSQCF